MTKKLICTALIICMLVPLALSTLNVSADVSLSLTSQDIKTMLTAFQNGMPTDPNTQDRLFLAADPYFRTNSGIDVLIGIIDGTIDISEFPALSEIFASFSGITTYKNEIVFILQFIKSIPAERRVTVLNDFRARESVALSPSEADALENVYKYYVGSSVADNIESGNQITDKVILNLFTSLTGLITFTDKSSYRSDFEMKYLNPDFRASLNANWSAYSDINGVVVKNCDDIIDQIVNSINKDISNPLKSDMKTVFEAIGMYEPYKASGGGSGSGPLYTPTPPATPTTPPTTAPPTEEARPTLKPENNIPLNIGSLFDSATNTANADIKLTDVEPKTKGLSSANYNMLSFNIDINKANTSNITAERAAIENMVDNNIDEAIITTDSFGVSLSGGAMREILDQSDGDITISVTNVDKETLPADVKATVGDNPVLDISIKSDGKEITDFGDNAISISIPFTLAENQNPEEVIVYYLSSDNILVPVALSMYDPITNRAVFVIEHLSRYTLAYNPITFDDIKGHWAEKNINFIATRSVVVGKGDRIFAPDDNVKRSEFVKMLFYLSSTDKSVLDTYKTSEFSDVTTDQWFAPYVMWAADKGIVEGYDDKTFGPDNNITREEMAVMLVRFTNFKKLSMPNLVSKITFKDESDISSWAKSAVLAIQTSGIISGRDTGDFDPSANATRAESAKIISEYIKMIVKYCAIVF